MELISILILLCYGTLLIALVIGFDSVSIFEEKSQPPTTKFSIIIPFRNEKDNLNNLLKSLVLLNYHKDYFEILMVNDQSTDNSVELIQLFKTQHPNLPIVILENNRKTISPKKDAIKTAIDKAQFEWIISTDADCTVPKNWLNTFNTFILINKPKLIAAPVTYKVSNSFLDQFQLFDFLSLQASTIGGFGLKKPFLCNGANLCYEKSVFNEVNGFKDNDKIASGDDIFLLEKIHKKYPKKVHFLKSKEALVYTKPEPSITSLISQRVRWASKTTSVNNSFTKLVGVIVMAMNFLWAAAIVLLVLNLISWHYLFTIITAKFILDFILLQRIFHFYKHRLHFHRFLLNSCCYPFFSMFVIFLSLKKGYRWKNRSFKK